MGKRESTKSNSNKKLGEFYTPHCVVTSLYEMINEEFGTEWKNDMVVWDPAWGTGNLTKEADFQHLFVSTIRQSDLIRSDGVSDEAMKFQYDFLNDDVDALRSVINRITHEYKMPEDLLEYFECGDKDILILMNPPYAGTGEFGSMSNGTKADALVNDIKTMMNDEGLGTASVNLYSQFIYRVIKMQQAYKKCKIHIAMICPPQFLSTDSYQPFRDYIFDNYEFRRAKLIPANTFENLSGRWGIGLYIWSPGKTENRNDFMHKAIEYDDAGHEVFVENKIIYNLNGYTRANDWVRDAVDNTSEKAFIPVLSSGCKAKDELKLGFKHRLGYIGAKGNNIFHNNEGVCLFTSMYSDGGGIPIMPENFEYACMYFTARRVMTGNNWSWINDKDEYAKPNLESTSRSVQEAIDKFKVDSLIYALFNTSSHASSLKNIEAVEPNGKRHKGVRVPNEFFWITKEDAKELLTDYDAHISDEMYTFDTERYMAEQIEKYKNLGAFSNKALDILGYANKLYAMTYKYRKEFKSDDGVDYQVTNWDAGWYQIKQLVKQYFPEEFKAFNKMTKDFGEELKPLIYQIGMLR